ncbi:MAG TPA: haloacid dehalogenase type II [Thermomicrobiales bacterium]|jgi:2-haloacid dehalogenase|nr:haloacid dehalogenase type II [Chloroflexota bacterium]HBY46757.1 haloacid dehalogenase type II [Chloroflexota bacterium]HCG29057.1 haloacid dehalogenase type II [Chloroflexota bacterium]HQZ89287.1 haloacid dehalogenase type II [Thermomicrobiales bacterium]HRA31710.1 haloacid dehalogenase type II [Thermomicrobiales bacterium]
MTIDLRRFSTLTFDCYGTLIDWESGILNALRLLLDQRGHALGDDARLELFGKLEATAEAGKYKPYREILATVAGGFGEQLGFETTAEERATFGASVPDWPAFPDSVAALRELKQHYKLVILSNVDDDLFAGSARRLEVPFDAVITAQQVGSYKPSPNNFRTLLERLGTPKEEILHVAQSLFHDIAPANAAGLTTIWVNRRHGRPGFGATPPQEATPGMEVPDLRTLATMVDAAFAGERR